MYQIALLFNTFIIYLLNVIYIKTEQTYSAYTQMDAFVSLKDIYCKQQQQSCLLVGPMRSPSLTLHLKLQWPAHYEAVINEFVGNLSSTLAHYQWMMQKVSTC